jgi:hypothetical protein
MTNKVKQLEKELREQKRLNNAVTEKMVLRDKELGDLASRCHAMLIENARLVEAAGVSAHGMSIERDELLARARRLEMRMKGLGADA